MQIEQGFEERNPITIWSLGIFSCLSALIVGVIVTNSLVQSVAEFNLTRTVSQFKVISGSIVLKPQFPLTGEFWYPDEGGADTYEASAHIEAAEPYIRGLDVVSSDNSESNHNTTNINPDVGVSSRPANWQNIAVGNIDHTANVTKPTTPPGMAFGSEPVGVDDCVGAGPSCIILEEETYHVLAVTPYAYPQGGIIEMTSVTGTVILFENGTSGWYGLVKAINQRAENASVDLTVKKIHGQEWLQALMSVETDDGPMATATFWVNPAQPAN